MLKTSRAALAALATLAAQTTHVFAASGSVERACAADYFSYCSQYDPEGAATRSCMKANGARLSQRCVNALVAAGEVAKSDTERKTARK